MYLQTLDTINMVGLLTQVVNTWTTVGLRTYPMARLLYYTQNDYFSNEQHVNCMKDPRGYKSNHPMTEIHYAGTLDTHLYNRFMLIGRK